MFLMGTPPAQVRFSPANILRNLDLLKLLIEFFGFTTPQHPGSERAMFA